MADDDVDPLDAFMESVSAELALADAHLATARPELVEADDPLQDYVSVPVEDANDAPDESDVVEANDDRDIALLPLVDHSSVKYPPFRKDILKPHPDLLAMTSEQIKKARAEIGVQIHGRGQIAAPGLIFGHLGLSDRLIAAASASGFETPTPVQSQAIPVALSGRDLIGVASTGSGKTAAFLWPLILHLQAQSHRSTGGPSALVLAPTRELSSQIYLEARKYLKHANKKAPANRTLRVAGVFGGMQMYQQSLELAAGVDLIVATPGRLLDHLRKGNTYLDQVTFVVIDEADRLLQMGFEAQARAILSQIRPDRQSLLFSATFKRRVESLARSILKDPVRIAIGTIGAASLTVRQDIRIFSNVNDRIAWLKAQVPSLLDRGQLIIFAGTRASCDQLSKELHPCKVAVMHGEKTQAERMEALHLIKKNLVQVVVATDVAARGLDLPSLGTVVNFELARDVDSHVHRIGRVGRKGQDGEGLAITLLSEDMEKKVARSLPSILANLEQSGQKAPAAAWSMARRLAPDECSRARSATPGSAGNGGGSYVPVLVRSNPQVTSGLGSLSESNKSSKRFESSGIGSAEQLRSQFRSSFQKSSHTLGMNIAVSASPNKASRTDASVPKSGITPMANPPSTVSSSRWDQPSSAVPTQAIDEPAKKKSRWDS